MMESKRPLMVNGHHHHHHHHQKSTQIRRTKSLHSSSSTTTSAVSTASQIPVSSGGLRHSKSQRHYYGNRRHHSSNDYPSQQQQNGFGLKTSASGISLPSVDHRGSFSSGTASTGSSFNDQTFFELSNHQQHQSLYHQMSALSLINGNGSDLESMALIPDMNGDPRLSRDDEDDDDNGEDFPFSIYTNNNHRQLENSKKIQKWPYRFYIIKQINYPPLYLENSSNHKRIYRTLVLGYPSSGKSSLIKQFKTLLTQQSMVASFNPADPEQLNRKENLFLHFLEIDSFDRYLLQTPVIDYQPDVYLILFSVNIRDSFNSVRKTLIDLQRWDDLENKTIIIVANKCDLARSRCVTRKEARELASGNNCKYIEISCTISHNIDVLLQGIGSQICLKEQQQQNGKSIMPILSDNSTPATSGKLKRKSSFFKRILRKTAINKSKSCDDLHVL